MKDRNMVMEEEGLGLTRTWFGHGLLTFGQPLGVRDLFLKSEWCLISFQSVNNSSYFTENRRLLLTTGRIRE